MYPSGLMIQKSDRFVSLNELRAGISILGVLIVKAATMFGVELRVQRDIMVSCLNDQRGLSTPRKQEAQKCVTCNNELYFKISLFNPVERVLQFGKSPLSSQIPSVHQNIPFRKLECSMLWRCIVRI